MKENKIPDSRLIIKLVNTGDAETIDLKVGIDIDGNILEITTSPTFEEKPVWIEITKEFDKFIGKSNANMTFNRFAPTKIFLIDINYFYIFDTVYV